MTMTATKNLLPRRFIMKVVMTTLKTYLLMSQWEALPPNRESQRLEPIFPTIQVHRNTLITMMIGRKEGSHINHKIQWGL